MISAIVGAAVVGYWLTTWDIPMWLKWTFAFSAGCLLGLFCAGNALP